jgi:hypothetical protein
MGGPWGLLRAAAVAAATGPHGVAAHEVRPAITDVAVSDPVRIAVALNAAAILAGIDLSAVADTDDAAQSERYDAPHALAARIEAAFPDFAAGLPLDGVGAPRLVSVDVAGVADDALPRVTRVVMDVPPEAPAPSIGWSAPHSDLILRRPDAASGGFAALLSGDEVPPPLTAEPEPALGTLARSVASGFTHIVPRCADRILFVRGLFSLTPSPVPLLWQVAAFTAAHAAALALGTLGVVSVPAAVAEPLIVTSLVHVGFENVVRPELAWRRPWWRRAVAVSAVLAIAAVGLWRTLDRTVLA